MVPPYHSASDGANERMAQTGKDKLKRIKPADVRTQFDRVLFQYRTTPHAVSDCTFCQLLLGRMGKTPLDVLRPNLRATVLQKQL